MSVRPLVMALALVLGLGVSGRAAVELLRSEGRAVRAGPPSPEVMVPTERTVPWRRLFW